MHELRKAFAALAVLIALIGWSLWNLHKRTVLIPGSKLYVKVPIGTVPRLWGNAVEFDHRGWQEICWTPDYKHVKCDPLKQASPLPAKETQ
jgi:hypothetical protein